MENEGTLAMIVFFSLAMIGVIMGLKYRYNFRKQQKQREGHEQRDQ